MAVRDDRSDVKQTTTGFRGPLMVQSLTSAKSKFLSLFNFNLSFSKDFLKRKLVFNQKTKDYLDSNIKSLSGLLAEVAMDKADKYYLNRSFFIINVAFCSSN